MNTRLLRLSFPFLAVALALGVEHELRFAPTEGTSVTRSFTEAVEFTLDSIVQTADGREVQQDKPDFHGSNQRSTTVTDVFEKVADGRLEKLKRSFDAIDGRCELAVESGAFEESYAYDLQSELTRSVVRFEWDEESEEFRATDEAGEAQSEYDGLEEDMDLRGLLPTKEIEKYESWEIAPSALIAVFGAGGDKQLLPDGRPEGGYLVLSPTQVMSSSLIALGELEEATGKIEAIWDETEDDHLAVIALEVDIVAICNGAERVSLLLEAIGAEPPGGEFVVGIEVGIAGEGRLVWNLEESRVESLQLTSELAIEVRFGWDLEVGSQTVPVEIDVNLSGTAEFAVELE